MTDCTIQSIQIGHVLAFAALMVLGHNFHISVPVLTVFQCVLYQLINQYLVWSLVLSGL